MILDDADLFSVLFRHVSRDTIHPCLFVSKRVRSLFLREAKGVLCIVRAGPIVYRLLVEEEGEKLPARMPMTWEVQLPLLGTSGLVRPCETLWRRSLDDPSSLVSECAESLFFLHDGSANEYDTMLWLSFLELPCTLRAFHAQCVRPLAPLLVQLRAGARRYRRWSTRASFRRLLRAAAPVS